MNPKTNLYTNLALFPFLVLTAFTGIHLHLTEHHGSAHASQALEALHIVSGIGFAVLAAIHIKGRRAWYKNLLRNFKTSKAATLLFSIVFAAVCLTGIAKESGLMPAELRIGLAHYQAGLALLVFAGIHTGKRATILLKNLKRALGASPGK